jgi:hypothetical protein
MIDLLLLQAKRQEEYTEWLEQVECRSKKREAMEAKKDECGGQIKPDNKIKEPAIEEIIKEVSSNKDIK